MCKWKEKEEFLYFRALLLSTLKVWHAAAMLDVNLLLILRVKRITVGLDTLACILFFIYTRMNVRIS